MEASTEIIVRNMDGNTWAKTAVEEGAERSVRKKRQGWRTEERSGSELEREVKGKREKATE